MRRFLILPVAIVAAGAAGFVVAAQQTAHPGQTEVRPGVWRAPDFPPPSILDYKPKSTLVTAAHLKPRAKYPVIDIHSHQPVPMPADKFAEVVSAMDKNNLKVLVNLSGGWGDELRQGIETIRASQYKDRMVTFANVNFRQPVGPGFGQQAAQRLEADIKAGAVGLKVFKDLGMFDKKADGSRLRVDDPELDPIWETCARLNVPVLIHVAEPPAFFQPLDYQNERWLELALFSNRRHQDGVRFEELMTERNNMIKRHPNTKYILAHFGWHANDLARAAKLLDENPNVYFDVAAVLYDFGRQPHGAHDFFVKYQDRILFGKDSFQPDEYPYYWRVFETADEYFDYYRDYHAFWKLYGLDLPDVVLKKLYYKNALKLVKGIPATGFPE
ncbi:MAG TPA: amidohydrolase family protein [Gemmatimonadaceae bacterium]